MTATFRSSIPLGRRLAQAVGLPQPLALQRHRSGQAGLANPVIIAGAGRLVASVQRLFSATDTVAATPATLKAPSTVKVQGAVFDASGVADLQQLDELYLFFHSNAKRLGQHGRVVVLGTAPEHCHNLPQAIAQRALEGLVRSLARSCAGRSPCNCCTWRRARKTRWTAAWGFSCRAAPPMSRGKWCAWKNRSMATPPSTGTNPLPATRPGHRRLPWHRPGNCPGAGARRCPCGVCGRAPGPASLAAGGDQRGRFGVALDITAADTVSLLQTHVSQYGAFDVVVHNAGITRDKTIAK